MVAGEGLSVLESRHNIAILLALINGPMTKSELYRAVSTNPRMPEKLAVLERAGLLTISRIDYRKDVVELTEKGMRVAGKLSELDSIIRS